MYIFGNVVVLLYSVTKHKKNIVFCARLFVVIIINQINFNYKPAAYLKIDKT